MAAAMEGDEGGAAAAVGPVGPAPIANQIHTAKARLSQLRPREAALRGELQEALALVERLRAESAVVRADVASAEGDLNALIGAPLGGDRNPFERLPDEIMLMIFESLHPATLCSGACERVCQRWARLMNDERVKKSRPVVFLSRWAEFAAGNMRQPRTRMQSYGDQRAVLNAIEHNGTVYSVSANARNVIVLLSPHARVVSCPPLARYLISSHLDMCEHERYDTLRCAAPTHTPGATGYAAVSTSNTCLSSRLSCRSVCC
jgi:hypothetical protein